MFSITYLSNALRASVQSEQMFFQKSAEAVSGDTRIYQIVRQWITYLLTYIFTYLLTYLLNTYCDDVWRWKWSLMSASTSCGFSTCTPSITTQCSASATLYLLNTSLTTRFHYTSLLSVSPSVYTRSNSVVERLWVSAFGLSNNKWRWWM